MKKPHEQELSVHPLESRAVINEEGLVVADIREPLNSGGREFSELFAAAPDMARALMALAEFVAALDAQPMRGIDDVLYSIHGGASNPGVGAEIRLSDLRRCVAALRKAGVLP